MGTEARPARVRAVLTDKLTARVLGGLFLVFPILMGGATLFLTTPALRSQKLYVGIMIFSAPLWIAGFVLLRRAKTLAD